MDFNKTIMNTDIPERKSSGHNHGQCEVNGCPRLATAADNLLAAAYEEDGAVDGILEKVDGHGKLQFVIYDLIDDRAVKCEINDSLLEQALLSFQKRIEVIGTVKYRKDGMPVGIKASRIINFPDKSEIPSLAQMRALLATGSKPSG